MKGKESLLKLVRTWKVLCLGLTFEPSHDKTNKMAYVPIENSDQPGHPPSLIRVFSVRMEKAWVLSYPLSAQRRLWSDGAPDFGSRGRGSNPAGGKILPEPKRHFIAQRLPCSPFYRLEMTEILLKGRKTLTHLSIWSDWADAQADLSLSWAHSHFNGVVMRLLIYKKCLFSRTPITRLTWSGTKITPVSQPNIL